MTTPFPFLWNESPYFQRFCPNRSAKTSSLDLNIPYQFLYIFDPLNKKIVIALDDRTTLQ